MPPPSCGHCSGFERLGDTRFKWRPEHALLCDDGVYEAGRSDIKGKVEHFHAIRSDLGFAHMSDLARGTLLNGYVPAAGGMAVNGATGHKIYDFVTYDLRLFILQERGITFSWDDTPFLLPL